MLQTTTRDVLYASPPTSRPTIWGLSVEQLHDHFWAALGYQVVRCGGGLRAAATMGHGGRAGGISPIGRGPFLLLGPDVLLLVNEGLATIRPGKPGDLLYLRLHNAEAGLYRERVVTDDADRFLRFERLYRGGRYADVVRAATTCDPSTATLWRTAPDARTGHRVIRSTVARDRRGTRSLIARVYRPTDAAARLMFAQDLAGCWMNPGATVPGIRQWGPGVWGEAHGSPDRSVRFVGPAWVGVGREFHQPTTVIGPAVLWDEPKLLAEQGPALAKPVRPPAARAAIQAVRNPSPQDPWDTDGPPGGRRWYQASKRLFDIVFSIVALAVTLPFYPLICALIWLEDGRPFFFAHRRETTGGRTFPCLKFRSMRRDAEAIKRRLVAQNQVDGPQFYMEDDPRMTRIGKFLRKVQVDELPQFINVLLGHMSVVGPRPSPYSENQYCPPWREARLSVRPGVTGLWQVKRKRLPGTDFQEWIKYDIEYVERAGFLLDLQIVFLTAFMCAAKFLPRLGRRGKSS